MLNLLKNYNKNVYLSIHKQILSMECNHFEDDCLDWLPDAGPIHDYINFRRENNWYNNLYEK
jgi:hypothetical protein